MNGIPLDQILVRHMFRFCAKKMRALYADKTQLMRKKDNCMWYYTPENSLHLYALQTNQWEEYEEYVTVTSQKDHSRQNFEALLNGFDSKKMEPIELRYDLETDSYIVEQGVHRLALLKHLGLIQNTLPFAYVKIKPFERTIALSDWKTLAKYAGDTWIVEKVGIHRYLIQQNI